MSLPVYNTITGSGAIFQLLAHYYHHDIVTCRGEPRSFHSLVVKSILIILQACLHFTRPMLFFIHFTSRPL